MILWRPTGLKELQLVRDADWRAWPPRLPEQPIFYPVTTLEYAEKIARDWNSVLPPPDDVGFVTRFEVSEEMKAKYPVQQAGGRDHEELWVPAEELEAFNAHIIGQIEVVAAFRNRQPLAVDEALQLVDTA